MFSFVNPSALFTRVGTHSPFWAGGSDTYAPGLPARSWPPPASSSSLLAKAPSSQMASWGPDHPRPAPPPARLAGVPAGSPHVRMGPRSPLGGPAPIWEAGPDWAAQVPGRSPAGRGSQHPARGWGDFGWGNLPGISNTIIGCFRLTYVGAEGPVLRHSPARSQPCSLHIYDGELSKISNCMEGI